jgi:hypothetical protein
MINSSCHTILDGELLFKPGPNGGKITRRMVIQIIDPLDDDLIVDANET